MKGEVKVVFYEDHAYDAEKLPAGDFEHANLDTKLQIQKLLTESKAVTYKEEEMLNKYQEIEFDLTRHHVEISTKGRCTTIKVDGKTLNHVKRIEFIAPWANSSEELDKKTLRVILGNPKWNA